MVAAAAMVEAEEDMVTVQEVDMVEGGGYGNSYGAGGGYDGYGGMCRS